MSTSAFLLLVLAVLGAIVSVWHTRVLSSRMHEQRARRSESARRVKGIHPTVQRDRALVIFYREHRFTGSLAEYDICDNGIRIGVSRSGTWFFENAKSGHHTYSGKIARVRSLELDIHVGGTYYIKSSIRFGLKPRPRLEPVSEAEAQAALAELGLEMVSKAPPG